jgi:hypothetical protein
MISNAYLPTGEQTVQHWYPAQAGEEGATPSGKIQRTISIPPMVAMYRKHMGGVDLLDQFRAYYKLELKSFKFWHPMFWFVVECALVNAWVLYCETMKTRNISLEYEQRTFRLTVAKQLAKEWEDMGCMVAGDTNQSPSKKLKHAVKKVRIHLRNKGIALDSQFDSLDGHAAFFAKLPERAGTSKKIKVNNQGTVIYPSHRSMDCRFCADVMKIKKRTSFWCKKCEKPLCKGVCFQKWHSPSSFAR